MKTIDDFCLRCARCCRIFSLKVDLNEGINSFYNMTLGEGFQDPNLTIKMVDENGRKKMEIFFIHPCRNLEGNYCKVYKDRHRVCKEFYCDDVKKRYEEWRLKNES